MNQLGIGLNIYLIIYIVIQVWLIVTYAKAKITTTHKAALIILTLIIMPVSLILYLMKRKEF